MSAPLQRLYRRILLGAALVFLPVKSGAAIELITGNDYVPYTDQRLPDGGFASEMIRDVLKEMGLSLTLRFLPWKRGFELTEAGEAMATFPYAPSVDRAKVMLFSEPLFTLKSMVFFNKENAFVYKNVDSLKGKTFCNPRGYVVYDEIREPLLRGEIKIEEPSDMASCARIVAAGRADFIITDTFTLQDVAMQSGVWDKLATSDKIFTEKTNHLIIGKNTKGGAEFLEKFNTALRKYKKSPAFFKLVDKYGLTETIR